jgi:hypothetical protein
LKHGFASVKFFADTLNFDMLMKSHECDTRAALLDKLQIEFLQYQVDSLPDTVVLSERIDTAWHEVSKIVDSATGKPKYRLLASVVKAILTINHSNADCERFFSTVRKNKTDFRASLNTTTLNNILVHKTAMDAKSDYCHTVNHSDKLQQKAKSATYIANEK